MYADIFKKEEMKCMEVHGSPYQRLVDSLPSQITDQQKIASM